MLRLDTDNDAVFLNEILVAYYREEGPAFTRSRPYRKNDQPCVEKKNNALARRLTGYDSFARLQASIVRFPVAVRRLRDPIAAQFYALIADRGNPPFALEVVRTFDEQRVTVTAEHIYQRP